MSNNIVPFPYHLLPTQAVRAVVRRNEWFILAPAGSTKEMVCDPDYWMHLGRRLAVNDRVEVVAEDGTFDLDLRVIAVDPRFTWVKMRVLREWQQDPSDAKRGAPARTWPDRDGYTVEPDGRQRFRIVNRGGDIVSRGHPNMADAIDELAKIKGERAEVA